MPRSVVRSTPPAHLVAVIATLAASPASSQRPADMDAASGRQLFEAACSNCHGVDGRGLDRALVGFAEALPDFTDCDFAAREPDADWVAIAHEGGPIRGFSRMMPAFRGALTPEQLGRIVRYIRTLCTDARWPAGELNLPRALLTEKAFPEDEWVVEAGVDAEGSGSVSGTFVWEQRFGPRSQIEIAIPYGWREVDDGGGGTDWADGLGDVVVGVKHTVHHSAGAGRILALGGEVALPTGDETRGFGAPGTRVEGFVSFGQILPSDAFVQLQSGLEAPLFEGGETEAFGRIAVGLTRTQGPWGRSWTPLVEVQGKRELEGGAEMAWDAAPQIQLSLNRRQHVLASLGVLLPINQRDRPTRLLMYVLLDWFDGGFFEGW